MGETDTTGGAGHVRPPRVASNLTGARTVLRAPRVERIGEIAVGLLAVADPVVAGGIGAKVTDMMESARRDIESLRRAGAEVVVLLAPVDKGLARKLTRDSGADVVILGKRVGQGLPRPEKIGRAFLVAPQEEMQRVGRLDLVLRGPPTPGRVLDLQDAGGAEASRLRREEINRALERLRVGLAKWTGPVKEPHPTDKSDRPDDTFLAAKKREQAELEAERTHLEIPWTPPPLIAGSYFVSQLVPLGRGLPRDPAVAAAMKNLDRRIAVANLKQAAPPPPPEAGRAAFVGVNKCAGCHAGAAAFWKQTVHARAWKTLVDGGKQADYKCVGCHATGFGQVGGSSLGYTKNLESVQCENCHGPGSLHVAGEGNEVPLAIKRDAPRDRLPRMPHRAALRHVSVRRLPARHRRHRARRETSRDARTRHHRPRAAFGRARQGESGRYRAHQEDVTVPASSWSSRSGSMLPPEITTTTRRPRIALGSSSSAASAGAADASHRIPRLRYA